jgi:hypothetical protein
MRGKENEVCRFAKKLEKIAESMAHTRKKIGILLNEFLLEVPQGPGSGYLILIYGLPTELLTEFSMIRDLKNRESGEVAKSHPRPGILNMGPCTLPWATV